MTKAKKNDKNVSYDWQLEKLKLFILSKRRMWGDLIWVFEIFKWFNNIGAEGYFSVDQSNITRRRNSFKIISERFMVNEAKQFFSNRVINV